MVVGQQTIGASQQVAERRQSIKTWAAQERALT
jgi:hypothetical protein